MFTGTHQRYWDAARLARGDTAGTRALIELLLAHRTLPADALDAAMRAAADTGVIDPQVVLIDARRRIGAGPHPAGSVIPLGGAAGGERPPPTLVAYDQLLTGSEG